LQSAWLIFKFRLQLDAVDFGTQFKDIQIPCHCLFLLLAKVPVHIVLDLSIPATQQAEGRLLLDVPLVQFFEPF